MKVNPKNMNGLYHVKMPQTEYDIMLQEAYVIGSPTIGRWMIGKSYWTVLKWIEKNGGKITKVNQEK
jgi:hypothetical protein